MELDSKQITIDRIMRLKSVETEEVTEIGRKEAGELRDFPIAEQKSRETYGWK